MFTADVRLAVLVCLLKIVHVLRLIMIQLGDLVLVVVDLWLVQSLEVMSSTLSCTDC